MAKATEQSRERRIRIGRNVKRLREQAGIESQQKLAELMGVSRDYIGRLESGHSAFGSRTEKKLAALFKVDISELYRPAGQSAFDEEVKILKEELAKYSGAETAKMRRIRQMLPALFGDTIDDDQQSDNPPDPRRKKSA